MGRFIAVGIVIIVVVGTIAYGATVWKQKNLDEDSRIWFSQADALHRDGNHVEASALLRKILSENPQFEERDHVRYLLGDSLADSSPDEARRQWNLVLEEHPSSQYAQDARLALARLAVADSPNSASELVRPLLNNPGELADDALLLAAQIEEKEGDTEAARQHYYALIERYPRSNSAGVAYDRLSAINTELLFSPTVNEFNERYKVIPGDNPIAIGSKFDSTGYLIEAINNLEGRSLRAGANIIVPRPGGIRIVIDMNENYLYVYQAASGRFIKRYPIGSTAYRERTPPGEYEILADGKMINPTWYPTRGGKVIPSGHPDNPLGTRWMGFDKEYHLGIHGTNEPESIGKSESEGCIRMHNEDVEELFMLARIGTPIEILPTS